MPPTAAAECLWWAWPYFVGVAGSFTDDFPVTEDFLELDSVDLSDPEDFEEAFLEGAWLPRLSVGVAEFRPSAAAASAFKAELR